MKAICIIDTSVLCEVLSVPSMCDRHEEVVDRMKKLIEAGTALLLPIAAVFETGNQIAQQGDGRQRGQAAQRFVQAVGDALDDRTAWTVSRIPDLQALRKWIAEFPDSATRGEGFGDLSIVKLFDEQCRMHRARRVFIWSFDEHLQGYDHSP